MGDSNNVVKLLMARVTELQKSPIENPNESKLLKRIQSMTILIIFSTPCSNLGATTGQVT